MCVCVVANAEDTATQDYLRSALEGKLQYEILLETSTSCNMSAYFNQAYEQTRFNDPGTLWSMFGDDFIFQTPGWDTLVLNWANWTNGVGLYFGDDCKGTGDNLAVYFFISRKVVDAIKPYPPMCMLFPVDDMDVVWDQTMRLLKKRFYIPGLKVFHNHATLPGQMDEVWKRSRAQMPAVHENRAKGEAYAETCAQRIMAAFPEEFHPDIDVIMTVCDRTDLLRESMQTYVAPIEADPETFRPWYWQSWERWAKILTGKPEKIYVFDDCSSNKETVRILVDRLPGVKVISRVKRLGCAMSTPAALRHMFDNVGSKAVLILDSDTAFFKYWWSRTVSLYNQLKDEPDFGCFSLFNANISPGTDVGNGLLKKLAVGAFGMLVTKDFWGKYIAPQETSPKSDWDNKACLAAVKDGKKVYCTAPSFLQHTGTAEGQHASFDMPAYATDFLGVYNSYKRYTVRSDVPGRSVLFCLPGRWGDIILGSMIVNMLIEREYEVSWVTLPHYADFVNLICRRAKVKRMTESMQMKWASLSTKEIHERYPGFRFYINAQPGSPEHHSNCVTSGTHMAWFVKQIVENIIEERLPDNFRDYLTLSRERTMDLADKKRPLAIIAPEAISLPKVPLTKERVNDLYDKYSVDYHVRILTPERPNDIDGRRAHERHFYGVSFEECLFLIRQSKLFIGNDSGLAWASLFSPCKKIIYHCQERIEQTAMFYNRLDPNAEDIIIPKGKA